MNLNKNLLFILAVSLFIFIAVSINVKGAGVCNTASFCGGTYEITCEDKGDGYCPEDFGDWGTCRPNVLGGNCFPCDPDCRECIGQTCGDGIIQKPNDQGLNEVCEVTSSLDCTTADGYSGEQPCLADCTGFDVCQTNLYCGDSIITEPIEECDDSNNIDGDGCSSNCLREPEEFEKGVFQSIIARIKTFI